MRIFIGRALKVGLVKYLHTREYVIFLLLLSTLRRHT